MTTTRSAFHDHLDEIHRDLVRAASRVSELVARATHVLLELDGAAAAELIDADDETDALTLDIEERCFTLLARQQPMAGDMRAIVTAIRMTAEIERSGDLVVNIAKATRRMQGTEIPVALRGLIERMSVEAVRLFRTAIDAYADGDAELAGSLDELDDQLDQVHRDFITALLESYAGVHDIQAAVQLALVGRYYERIGDHAVNIGERVGYMVTGWMPEHAGAARHAARAQGHPVDPGPP